MAVASPSEPLTQIYAKHCSVPGDSTVSRDVGRPFVNPLGKDPLDYLVDTRDDHMFASSLPAPSAPGRPDAAELPPPQRIVALAPLLSIY